MLCLECGHLNQANAKTCENCQRMLPDRKQVPPHRSGHYDMLVDSVNKVKNLQISSGEFASILSRLQNLFSKSLDDITRMDIPEDIAMELGEEMRTGTDGIKLYLEAVVEMSRYIDSRNPLFLDRGLLMAKDANNRLNQAMRMNWDNFRNLQDTTEEFIRSQTLI